MSDNTAPFKSEGSGGGSGDSTPFVSGTNIDFDRLAAAGLGLLVGQIASGWASLLNALVTLIEAPFETAQTAGSSLLGALFEAPIIMLDYGYATLRSWVVEFGVFGYVIAVGVVLALGLIFVIGRDALG
jgi:hypothetical protein